MYPALNFIAKSIYLTGDIQSNYMSIVVALLPMFIYSSVFGVHIVLHLKIKLFGQRGFKRQIVSVAVIKSFTQHWTYQLYCQQYLNFL